jgi:hypothetical protein
MATFSISGKEFTGVPPSCGWCPFFFAAKTDNRGVCTLFNLNATRYRSTPKRCAKLFAKAEQIGGELVIISKY